MENPKLSEDEQQELENDLTKEELLNALQGFKENKTPGEDGFTKEFYETFFDLMGDHLLDSYNEAFYKGKMSISLTTRQPEKDISRARIMVSPRFLYQASLKEKRYLTMQMRSCEEKLKGKTAHFRLPSASQKRACLSSLMRELPGRIN